MTEVVILNASYEPIGGVSVRHAIGMLVRQVAVVEEAVSVGDLVRLLTFRQGQANLVELTLAPDANIVGKTVGSVTWPADSALVAILREGRVIVPTADNALEAGDELLLVATTEVEAELDALLSDEV